MEVLNPELLEEGIKCKELSQNQKVKLKKVYLAAQKLNGNIRKYIKSKNPTAIMKELDRLKAYLDELPSVCETLAEARFMLFKQKIITL